MVYASRCTEARECTSEERRDYDWLLLRRLDLVQYRKFDLAGLSPSLFYLSNDCDVTWVGFVKGNGTFEIGSAGMFTSAPLKNINLSLPRMSCLRTVPHRQSHPATAGERLRVQGRAHPQVSTAADKTPVSNSFGGDWFDRDFWEVPDFNFLSSPENMERVFCGLLAHSGASRPPQPTSDYFKASHLGGRIAPSAARSRDLTLHKLLAWRLAEVGLEDRLAHAFNTTPSTIRWHVPGGCLTSLKRRLLAWLKLPMGRPSTGRPLPLQCSGRKSQRRND